MKWIDLPPVWLLFMIVLAWVQDRALPLGPEAPFWLRVLGALLVLAGIVLSALAALRFARARTTIVPHRTASAIVTTGIYRLSRNPIYLGDASILTGAVLWFGAWPSLVLVPVFVAIITRRFIQPEEQRLRDAFPAEFDAYAARVRRWL